MDLAGLKDWLAERLAGYLELPVADLRYDVSLATYGLDSMYLLMLCGDIEDNLGLEIQAEAAWQHTTINALAEFVVEQQAAQAR